MAEKINYIDFDIDGVKTITNDIEVNRNEEAIKKSIATCLLTEKNSRGFRQKNFGTALKQFVFQPVDNITARGILNEVERAISVNIPKAKNVIVEVIPLDETNTFEINIDFSVLQSERVLQLKQLLKQLR